MEEKVLETIRRNGLFAPGDKVIVAVSGGPDSLCLLHLLSRLAGRLAITLQVVHVNHGLRPEATREAFYVKNMADKLGLPATVYRADVRKLMREGGFSLQDAARRVRYRCLRQAASRSGARCIVTAHHEDDRVETLLQRLLGGSGLDGLAGLRVKRAWTPDLLLARPLYHVNRQEIIRYCRTYQLRPLLDRSNRETRYLRNRVRLRLLPWLEEEFGRHVRGALARTCDLLAGDSELLGVLAKENLERVLKSDAGGPVLDVAALRLLPLPLRQRVVRLALWQAGVERPSAIHIRSVLNLSDSSRPAGKSALPGGFTAVREYGLLRIEQVAEGGQVTVSSAVPLVVPGNTLLPWSGQAIWAEILPATAVRSSPVDRREAYLDLDRLELPLLVRTRCPGDRMKPLGACGRRKLKKILTEKKVPLAQRDKLPLVLSGECIAWVGGVEIADFCKVSGETRQVLRLRIQDGNGQRMENMAEKCIGKVLLDGEVIRRKISELGAQISRDYAEKDLLLICVLKGAVVFLSDLMRHLTTPVQVDFMAVSSYGTATETSGAVRILHDLEGSIAGRHCLIVEDIVDSGLTLKYLQENLRSRQPASLKIVALLDKPERRRVEIQPDYVGFRIPDEFVVGYGLDFNEQYRYLPDICVLSENNKSV